MNTEQRITEFEIRLVRLATLMAEGRGKSEEAWELRDHLAGIEAEMTEAECASVYGLSSDLYMIEEKEIYDDVLDGLKDSRVLARAMQRRYATKRWGELLTLLRQRAEFLPEEIRAYLRGRAYEELGYRAAAWAFYQDAARRDTEDDRFAYQYLALYNLRLWDSESAYRQANVYLDDAASHPVMKILAVNVMLQHVHQDVEGSRPDNLEQNVPGIREWALQLLGALGTARESTAVPKEILASGYGGLAFILAEYQDYGNAADMLRLVDRYMPGDPEVRRRIERYDALNREGKSLRSGILLNPEELFVEPTGQRLSGFYSLADNKVERVFSNV